MAFKVSTKKDKNAAEVETLVTVIYDNPTAERALATQALIVKAQGGWRKNGIPASITLKMSEYAPGTRHAATVDPLTAAKSMTPEERARLIAELKALDAAK